MINPDLVGKLDFTPAVIVGSKQFQPSTQPQYKLSTAQKQTNQQKYDPSSKCALIVDTNILLKQMHLADVLNISHEDFEKYFDVITLDRVISEVKDEKAREYINTRLPYKLDVRPADTFLSQADIDCVHDFAKDTGDYRSLSKVDMMVIAAGVKLAKDKGEIAKVKMEPKDLSEFKPEHLKQAYDAFSSDSDSDDEKKDSDESSDEQK